MAAYILTIVYNPTMENDRASAPRKLPSSQGQLIYFNHREYYQCI